MLIDALAALSAGIWIYLIFFRGHFWTANVRDAAVVPHLKSFPVVAVVMPARDEAAVIGAPLKSLLTQDYPGPFSITVVDDDSSDGTAAEVGRMAAELGTEHQVSVSVVKSNGPPTGWSGKLWAIKQGIAAVETQRIQPEYIMLTDADIVHAPDAVRWLVAQSTCGGYVLTSLMAKLRCKTAAERIHVPAFVFFFQMLYPFFWVNQRDSAAAAAAGGCMLVRADVLRDAGGIDSIRSALIDDCALAKKLKSLGPIWLGLTDRVRSIRPYNTMADTRQMISRCAYSQLHHSPLLLAAVLAGMALVFVAPPVLAIFGHGIARWLGLATWLAMALAFQPMLRFYRVSPLWGSALPAIAFLYSWYTIDSAFQHARRSGGLWKGRVYANVQSVQ
jgi:hopene-associated glycosyltransferase HpnB